MQRGKCSSFRLTLDNSKSQKYKFIGKLPEVNSSNHSLQDQYVIPPLILYAGSSNKKRQSMTCDRVAGGTETNAKYAIRRVE